MAWIKQVPVQDATGALESQFDSAIERVGRVFNIVHVMSLNPAAMQSSMGLYGTLMHGDSPLSRFQREMLATVVAAELQCRY